MTIIKKQYKNKNYYITMEWDKNNIYIVEVCSRIDENLCGYPIKKMIYSLNELEKANNTYKRYIKKYI